MKWDFRKIFGGFHDSCIGRGSVNFDSSTTVSAISKAVSYRNVKSCARMSDTIRGTRFCSVNIYKSVPKIPNFQSLGDRQNKQLINSKQTSNDNFRPILP